MAARTNARDWQTRIRLWAALLMAFYFISRMGYYAMGLISPDAMEEYLNGLSFLWILTPFFLSVIFVHMALGLWKIFKRNTLKMPLWELAQIGFGLSLPYFLFPYLVTTYVMGYVFGLRLNYVDSILLTYPAVAWSYVCVAIVMGVHGNIGANAVLRMRPWYPRIKWLLIGILALIPISAALGYLRGGSQLYRAFIEGRLAPDDMPHTLVEAQRAFIAFWHTTIYISLSLLFAFVFIARSLRLRAMEKRKTIRVVYPSGAIVPVIPGTTILEASRIGSIPHASICGGRSRCTTCRIKVEAGMDNLSPVSDRERRALLRIGAASNVRLACQAQCQKEEIRIVPLLPAKIGPKKARSENRSTIGRDVELSVMFVDLRGFTGLSEGKFAYDVVYILNTYFENMGRAIEKQGGRIDKFLGDGILAYFGLDRDPRDGALSALRSTVEMARELANANRELKEALDEPLAIGIGLHYGDVILGEVGYKEKSSLTIIGDTVNTASRLQSLNKSAGTQLIVSTALAAKSGVDLSYLPMATATVRGKTEPLRVFLVKDLIRDLPRALSAD